MINNLKKEHKIKEIAIKSKLNEFKNKNEKEQYSEFIFCLLTPQSKAQSCWAAVEQLQKIEFWDILTIENILKSKTRFYKTKAKRILASKETWEKIKPSLSSENSFELRNLLEKEVNGYGLKEASHFLRNIGKSNNQIAILDRHILKNLAQHKAINTTKIKSKKHYLELENQFKKFANSLDIAMDELDLLWWSQENGEIFK